MSFGLGGWGWGTTDGERVGFGPVQVLTTLSAPLLCGQVIVHEDDRAAAAGSLNPIAVQAQGGLDRVGRSGFKDNGRGRECERRVQLELRGAGEGRGIRSGQLPRDWRTRTKGVLR